MAKAFQKLFRSALFLQLVRWLAPKVWRAIQRRYGKGKSKY